MYEDDDTLKLLEDVSKILEFHIASGLLNDNYYISRPLYFHDSDESFCSSSTAYSIHIENDRIQDKNISDNGTYVVCTESDNSIDKNSDEFDNTPLFPYVENFINRVKLIKNSDCLNKNKFDAFWVDLNQWYPESGIKIEDSLSSIIPAQKRSLKDTIIIEEIDDVSVSNSDKFSIDSIAERIVKSLLDEVFSKLNDFYSLKEGDDQFSKSTFKPVEIMGHDETTDLKMDTKTSNTVPYQCVLFNESSLSNVEENCDDLMPIEFKYLLLELRERKSKIEENKQHRIDFDDMLNVPSKLNSGNSVLVAGINVSKNEVRGVSNKEDNNIIIIKKFKEVTNGCGITVGTTEERSMGRERVGKLNTVGSHRDGLQSNANTTNTPSRSLIGDNVFYVDRSNGTNYVDGLSGKISESIGEIQLNDSRTVRCINKKEFRNDNFVKNISTMRDLEEAAFNKSKENFVDENQSIVLNRENSDVICEILSPTNGYNTLVCDEVAFNNNNAPTNKGDVLIISAQCDETNSASLTNGNHYESSENLAHNVSFKKVNGGENFQTFHAPVRKLMSRSRKCIRAGNRRDARRRVTSIRRSDVTPQPSVKKLSSCAGCLLLRVAPSGPFLLLDLSATESKSDKTFTNKLLSLEEICSCKQKYISKPSLAQETNNLEEKKTDTDSLQVANNGANKSKTSKESENNSLKSSSKLCFEKQIPVSLIDIENKNCAQSDSQNKLIQSSSDLRVRWCSNSFTNKLIHKDVSGANDLFIKENSAWNSTLPQTTNHLISNENKSKSSSISNHNNEIPKACENLLLGIGEEPSDSVNVLTSRVLNSFEVSSRLKRLEGKLRSSLESLKDSSIKEIDGETFIEDTSETQCEESNVSSNLIVEKSDDITASKTSDCQQIDVYTDSIQNNLEEFLQIHKNLKINEYCTERGNNTTNSCPTKCLLDERRDCENNNEHTYQKEDSFEFGTDVESDVASDAERNELEEFERQERWASNEEYFSLNASIFSTSSCQFSANDVTNLEFGFNDTLTCYDELLDSSGSLSSADEETVANTLANSNMRGEGPATDRRHNKDASNLKSLLKKASRKGKKNRVVFNENKNEFFEADYIILIREECQYDEESDEGVCTCSQHEMVRLSCCESDCNGCEQDECSQESEPVTLSPPEGYKDNGMFNKDGTVKEQGLFNKDGTLRDQGLYARPGGLLVGESSGTVFSPQHLHQLQLIQRLQTEQLRRAKVALGSQERPLKRRRDSWTSSSLDTPSSQKDGSTTTEGEGLEDRVEDDDPEEERSLRQPKLTYAKEIVAGEERPKVNSGQQTTPTDEEPSEENSSEQLPTHQSSPMRLGGILKGGRLWKASNDTNLLNEQTEDSPNFRDSASDEEGRINRAVRFSEPTPSQCGSQISSLDDTSESQDRTDPSSNSAKPELSIFRIGSHLLSNNSLRPNSAVRQLFPTGPHFAGTQRADSEKQYLVTAESLRAFEEGKRSTLPTNYREEDLSVRRTIDRNTLRRSLVKVDVKKKSSQKNDNSLSERIKMLTCNIDDEEVTTDSTNETERCSPSTEETLAPVPLPTKCFSPSSSSSSASSCSSTSSTYKKLTDIFPKRQERIPECNEEGSGVIIIPQNDKIISNSRTRQTIIQESKEYLVNEMNIHDQPAPDVLAGTPGAGEGDELARFVQQESARTERLRKKYNQQTSTENSDDDDQDDYGFSDRPTVRGIKPHFGSTNEILQQMQTQMMPQQTPRPGHISWPYYSESNLTMPAPHEHTLHHNVEQQTNRPLEDYHQQATLRLRERLAMQGQRESLGTRYHEQLHDQHHDQHHENIYQNCMTYVNLRCNGNERDLYAGQPHMATHMHSYARQHRRPESPPPIRSYHQTMVLLPYSNLPHQPHYSNTTTERNYHAMSAEQNNVNEYPTLSYPKQKDQILHSLKQGQQAINLPYQAGIPMQLKCSAPMAHVRTVQPRPLAQQMICFSEKVKAPLYQAAPGSPGVTTTVSGSVRGVPEGAPAPAASPTAPQNQPHQHNSLYYAMNV